MKKVCFDDWIVIEIPEEINTCHHKLLHLKAKTSLNLGKKLGKISSERFVGLAYGSYWEIVGSEIVPWELPSISSIDSEQQDLGDNKSFFDDNSAQLLDSNQLSQLKEQLSSEELVQKLVQNSTTFDKKTKFSQEKYKKRKSLKYAKVFKIIQSTSTALLCNFFSKATEKIMGIRQDSLSMILSLANAQAGMKALVLDETHGLISLALLERIKSSQPFWMTFVKSIFPDILYNSTGSRELHEHFSIVPIESLTNGQNSISPEALENQNGAAKYNREKKAIDLFQSGDHDALVIAVKDFNAFECLNLLVTGLAPSGAVVIYSPFRESLLECYEKMMHDSRFVNVHIYESFLREYQVLPGRTHPHMKTSGGGGYILSAIKVID